MAKSVVREKQYEKETSKDPAAVHMYRVAVMKVLLEQSNAMMCKPEDIRRRADEITDFMLRGE
jgi:hypothetical protein